MDICQTVVSRTVITHSWTIGLKGGIGTDKVRLKSGLDLEEFRLIRVVDSGGMDSLVLEAQGGEVTCGLSSQKVEIHNIFNIVAQDFSKSDFLFLLFLCSGKTSLVTRNCKIDMACSPSCLAWAIWNERNQATFNRKALSHDAIYQHIPSYIWSRGINSDSQGEYLINKSLATGLV